MDKYLHYTLEQEHKHDKKIGIGPVITISREFGCPSREIAELLHLELCSLEKKPVNQQHWRIIKKEILEEAAKELGNIDPEKLEYIFRAEKKTMAEDILQSFTQKYYKSDRQIRKTIIEVIREFAEKGHVIIVGRAGVAITSDITNSLHIRLVAPLKWRAERLAAKHNVSYENAEKTAIEIDQKRLQLIDDFKGKPTDHTIWDLMINCKRLSIDDIVTMIINTMKLKKMV